MQTLDKRFNHRTWYKGEKLTRRQAMDKLHKNLDIYLTQKPSLKQSDNMLDSIAMDNVLTDGRSFYRLSIDEYDYYINL